ncbi:alpha/beta hydrolase [Roseibium denhamense]|uniref:Pimeloyl-ACP methyl ester carboxylesterase n=1 Tax=Roseibium denhamense TaxID=76305 RepID=A0ABY1NVG2_9HYPH|nr:alpha/beta hydrolase [Roseibium denhamense]MTI04447.1 alpha/beta hydrolase [Roseibium denhamense]SMP19446.1 Pimeloyl-ACP methyl ester carboxylesterase [Roseibium denhamense]
MTITESAAGHAKPDEPLSAPEPLSWTAPDGLRLAGRVWRPSTSGGGVNTRIPVLCLPGLSRNTRDFDDIAITLQKAGHVVFAFDYRGRGDSDWDADWRNYALPMEEKDIDAGINFLGLERFALLGTSRGGLHALAMSYRYPADKMVAVILNDIGPHIEMRAIHRIAATLGHNMKAGSIQEIAENQRHMIGHQFPNLTDSDWEKLARQLASRPNGGVALDYDPALAHQFASLDDAAPAPDLWPLFDNLTDRPVLIIHGENSDLLSGETCREMLKRHSGAKLHTVQGEGHAPLLWDVASQQAIRSFLQLV